MLYAQYTLVYTMLYIFVCFYYSSFYTIWRMCSIIGWIWIYLHVLCIRAGLVSYLSLFGFLCAVWKRCCDDLFIFCVMMYALWTKYMPRDKMDDYTFVSIPSVYAIWGCMCRCCFWFIVYLVETMNKQMIKDEWWGGGGWWWHTWCICFYNV